MPNRDELERAIAHIADNVRFLQTHHNAGDSLMAHEIALSVLRAELSRESQTCEGCMWDAKTIWNVCFRCSRCNRLIDCYEPKGEQP